MNLQEKVLSEFQKGGLKYKSFNQLFLFLSNKLKTNPDDIAKCINKLLQDGTLIDISKNHLELAGKLGYKKGIIVGNSKGFAFVKPVISGRTFKRDVDFFIPAGKLFGALDGDEVLFKEEREKSASVIKILKRKNNFLVGTLVKGANLKFKNNRVEEGDFYVVPDNDKFSKPILISRKELKEAKENDRVEVELIFQPEGARSGFPIGRVKKVLSGDEIENGITAILCEYQIPDEFPGKVIKEAEGLKTDFSAEKKKRINLTEKLIVTIDGADAKDLDDAISVERLGDGYILGVHIADVGEYVKYDTELDREAFIRGTSVYFPDRVYPMLPQRLSNDLCSLNPNEEKLTLSVEMRINKFGVVESYEIFESVIKSRERLTYDKVYEVIRGSSKSGIADKKIIEMLLLAHELSMKVGDLREKDGALDFDISETHFDMDGKNILNVRKKDRNEAHKLIENFMILCNKTVAKHFFELRVPFVYRVHEKPSSSKFNEILDVLKTFGTDLKQSKNITPKYVQGILDALKNKEYSEIANKIVLRSLEKAFYLEKCIGHFGLALEYYCHFTSPIRRYPDLTIHRIIKRACRLQPNNVITSDKPEIDKIRKSFESDYNLEAFVIDSAFQSSEREKKSDDAERDVDDLFKAKYMQDKIGQVFAARICGVNSFGLFIVLDNTVEGLIKIESLPDDDYKFDETRMVLKGRRKKFTIGDKLKVVLNDVNLTNRRIEFSISKN